MLKRRRASATEPSEVLLTEEKSDQDALQVAIQSRQSVVATLKKFGKFWYDFIFGDDWRVAAIVVLGLLISAMSSGVGLAFLLLPAAVIAATGVSTLRPSR
jgi:hypothetical protein